ncbi:MAG: AhpC/TSA family protein [Desulfobacterales bacterium]|nr:MAG: AhpC/TSA family protein [Desulfobacterales bacterium]
MELEALQSALPELTALGAILLTVSPQLPEHSRELIKQKKFTFDMLSDPGNQVAQKFGLVYEFPEDLKKIYLQFGIDVPHYNGEDSWTLPLPARYIVDRNAKIRYAAVNPDYTVRPDPAHTITALREIQS